MGKQASESSKKGILREACRLGLGGAKDNLAAATVLWVVGILIVVGYFQLTSVQSFLDEVGAFKDATSPWFAVVSTAVFGALVPYLFQLIFQTADRRQTPRQVLTLMLFWGVHGWQVDLLYQLQADLFGSDSAVPTLLKKLAIDQFVWGPLLALPQVLLTYLWMENDFSLTRVRESFRERSYLARAIPLQIASWSVWIPAVSLIYLLPLPLQLPLQNLILAMWSLILIFFARHGSDDCDS